MPIKVLHLCAAIQSGGIERVILANHCAMQAMGVETSFCYLHHPENADVETVSRRARRVGCPMYLISDAAPVSIAAFRHLIRLLKDLAPQIVHAHEYKSNVLALLLRPVFGFHTVTTVHGWVDPRWRPTIYYALDRRLLALHDHVVAVSKDLAAACRRAGVPNGRLLLMENTTSITDEQIDWDKRSASRRLVLGSVGRLSIEKGHDLLIAAAVRLLDEGHDIEVRVVGEGPERGRLVRLIARTPYPDRFLLTGFVEHVEAAYAGFDALCIASRREGLPNVLLEALAFGIPVVATAVGGIPEFVDAGCEAVIVPPNSVEALTDGLRGLIADPRKRAAIAACGHARLHRNRTPDRNGDLAKVYRRLADREITGLPMEPLKD